HSSDSHTSRHDKDAALALGVVEIECCGGVVGQNCTTAALKMLARYTSSRAFSPCICGFCLEKPLRKPNPNNP
ncbi:MAG: hypothetical protein Q4A97_04025, partial [Comamonadaceae bacterium]|nr:hypothetical protein [Comamonadaceae bacterium]